MHLSCFVDQSTNRVDPKRYEFHFRSPKLTTRLKNRIVTPASSYQETNSTTFEASNHCLI